jgi:hypothetical protein
MKNNIYKFIYNNLYLLLLLTILILGSCEENVEVDISNHAEKIIIDGLITDSLGYNYIKLYKVSNYYSNKNDSISNCIVMLFYNNDSIYFAEPPGKKGFYCNNNFYCKPGIKYHLVIKWKENAYEAYAEMLNTVDPFYLNIYPLSMQQIDIQYSHDTTHFKYLVYINDTLKNTIDWFWVTPLENAFGDGFTLEYPFKLNDKIKIERQSLTYDTYRYFVELKRYFQIKESPYSSPPEMPSGNITNGGLGIFRASSISIKSGVIKPY